MAKTLSYAYSCSNSWLLTPDSWLQTSAVQLSFFLYVSLGFFDRADTLISCTHFECNTTSDPKPIPLPTVPFAYSNSCQKLMLTSRSLALLFPASRLLTTLQWLYCWLSLIVWGCTCSSTTTSDYRRYWLKMSKPSALWRRRTSIRVDITDKVT